MTAPETPAPSAGPREDPGPAARIARSAAAREGARLSTEQFAEWLAGRGLANDFKVEKIPFADLVGWSFDPDTGNLVHRSGRFFSVEGLHVTVDDGPYREWHQPVIKQPEVGILGILVKEFDGVLHCLMQAKMEPGNRNLLQLSPTVQATRSNYTKVHQGADVKYIEYFIGGRPRRVLADVLQSEHGSWFFHKSNRNMIVEALDDVPLDEDFCWLTFGQIAELLGRDNVVNMDSRTVLSCAPVADPAGRALHSDTELLSWFTGQRSRYDIRAERVPLAGLPGWKQGEESIDHEQGRFFKVVAVNVTAGSREVTSWTQPLIEPVGPGVAAFLTRRIDGVRHVLAHAKVEGGFLDAVELAPTVQCTPGNHDHRPPFLDRMLDAAPEQVRYRAVHSEEGGRFLHAEADYLIVEEDEREPLREPEGYAWVTPGQLSALVRHGHYVNVQARTLLAVLNGLPQDD
ncbi:NDP-hexose 2,3-dehydratase family protein [Kitasatospora sp. NPDC088391]|uniref:NDP-hexose 2,3-dehydratase family protein n=1 Tax=Kitasatospora sp. NPDC088391 TaxID=3364074 RepID=UPI003813D1B1